MSQRHSLLALTTDALRLGGGCLRSYLPLIWGVVLKPRTLVEGCLFLVNVYLKQTEGRLPDPGDVLPHGERGSQYLFKSHKDK